MTDNNSTRADREMTDSERITPSDITERVREVLGGAGDTAEEMSSVAVAAAAAVATGLVLAAFLFGRRRGRRRSTVVEVVRM